METPVKASRPPIRVGSIQLPGAVEDVCRQPDLLPPQGLAPKLLGERKNKKGEDGVGRWNNVTGHADG